MRERNFRRTSEITIARELYPLSPHCVTMNRKNPAVRRIMADVKELQTHPSSRYFAQPLEDNMFEWHFTIRGPADTPFAEGIYHGRILLPAEYPMKPPNIVFLTKNGRFEVGTKICLSISAYHEETWQPAWGVRTMLEAIISFMPTEGMGAIGALDWTPEERRKLATESKNFCCSVCGKVAALLSDPKDDAKPSAEEASAAQELAAQVAQLQLKAAPAPSSPHVPGSQAGLMQEYGEANLGGNVFSGISEGGFGESSSESVGMATGSATGAAEAALDGSLVGANVVNSAGASTVADMLPDLSLRLDDLQCTMDAQDNYDNMGLMEQEDVIQSTAAQQTCPSDVDNTPHKPVNSGIISTPTSSAKKSVADVGSPSAGAYTAHSPAMKVEDDVASVLRQRRGVRVTPDASASSAANAGSSTQGVTSAVSSPAKSLFHGNSDASGEERGEQQGQDNETECAPVEAIPVPAAAAVQNDAVAVEATAQAEVDMQAEALREVVATRAHIQNAMAEVNNRMRVIDQHLAHAQEGVGMAVGEEAVPAVAARRDSVDEWLGVVLVALGSTIALMMWRIVTRYYTLFLS